MPYDVICPSCNESFHETTEEYLPDVSPNGKMFRLKDKYRENGWLSFVEDESSVGDELYCPECGGQYREGPEGRVRVLGHPAETDGHDYPRIHKLAQRHEWPGAEYIKAEPVDQAKTVAAAPVRRRKLTEMVPIA